MDFVYCVRNACALGKKMCWEEQELVHTRPFLRVVRDLTLLNNLSYSTEMAIVETEKCKSERIVQSHVRPSSIFSATLNHSISCCIAFV